MEALGIDLKTLIFQLINFLVLLVLLTKLLHKPLKKLMEDREREIAEGLENAAKAKLQLEEAEVEREKLLAKADKEGRALIDEVKKQASELEQKLSAEAQANAEKLLARTRNEIQAEREQLKSELKGELATMVVSATEKVLASPIPDKEKRQQMKELVNEVQS
ncbi:MAG TPA: F0F1 ATP synthase subunit B [Verrucomicrobiae bacterium]|nr:F0F1 ATP synthase subunit B [Verrucomicrobiae bacterium]